MGEGVIDTPWLDRLYEQSLLLKWSWVQESKEHGEIQVHSVRN